MAEQRRLRFVKLSDIEVGERFRVDYGNIQDLAESIKDKGILQPITVAPGPKGKFILLAGGRRYAACSQLGMKDIPALVKEVEGEIDSREIELIENVFRQDMHWSERARLIQRIDTLCREKNVEWSGRKTAQLLGQANTNVARSLALAQAMEAIPELAKQETQQQAEKLLNNMAERHVVNELRERQTREIAEAEEGGTETHKGVARMLSLADANYRIGDVFGGMAEMKTNGMVNLIECDPPYGIDLTETKMGRENATSTVRNYNEIPTEAYKGFLNRLAKELYRVGGTHCWLVFWFGPTWHTDVRAALEGAGWKVDPIPCIWSKRVGQTMQPSFNLARTYEPFFLARKGSPAIFKQGRSNVFDFPPTAGNKKYHPTERPLALMEEILDTLVAVRSVVFCPFLGSGVTLRACYRLGITAWGYDVSGEYKDRFMLAVEEDTRQLDSEKEDEGEQEAA